MGAPGFLPFSLDIAWLQGAYRSGVLTPSAVVRAVYARIAARGDDHVWTFLRPQADVLEEAKRLEASAPAGKPLYGLPFSVKDNIHVAALPTTAGCPAFTRMAVATAPAVAQAAEAGALLIGKNTLDQFATGLVGIRSPAGYCRNTFDERYIPGGSSSGSGVAVAAGLVSFALGSDTGGSGRVPAALNNIVGLKPSVGLVSNEGMVYCNRSFDCMPVFALTCDDAWRVLRCIRDKKRPMPDVSPCGSTFAFAVPRADQLEFFGDALAEQAFARAIGLLQNLGGKARRLDFTAFLQAGRMVFDDALIAERYAEYGEFVEHHPDDVLPVTQAIITKARGYSAVDAYRALYRLDALRRQASIALADADCLVVPTTGTIYRCDEVEADPIALNTNMGYYTYFVNPLDLCAIAVPAGFRDDGLPHGVSLIARAGEDATLVDLARRLQAKAGTRLGSTPFAHPAKRQPSPAPS